jgi:hypothetical protein
VVQPKFQQHQRRREGNERQPPAAQDMRHSSSLRCMHDCPKKISE